MGLCRPTPCIASTYSATIALVQGELNMPDGIRTHDILIKSQVLLPTELQTSNIVDTIAFISIPFYSGYLPILLLIVLLGR